MRKILAAFAVLSLAACGGTMQDDSATSQSALQNGDIRPTGKGVVHQFAHTGGGSKHTTSNGITNHGGPVMTGTVNVYYIWYGNWSNNTGTTLLPKLVSDLSGSGYEHINTTYYSSNGTVSGNLKLVAQTTDSYSQGTSFGDSGVQAIVQKAINSGALGSVDPNGLYMVLTSADVNETSGFCTQYCGWHTHATINGVDVKYSFVGNADRCLSACADQSTSPNGNAGVDAMASIIAHESEEAISDPDLNAWYDNRGQENADKCAWTFGSTSKASNGSLYNFSGTSGTKWLIQQNWVNASGGFCAMSH